MLIFPAIDLYQGQAVRLYQGDYAQKTVYSADPLAVARDFAAQGAKQAHLVDLQGAESGGTPHLKLICEIREKTGLFCEVGGGIRSMDAVNAYLDAGVDRVILGTAAATDPAFLESAVARYGEKIAVGADLNGGKVAIRGWKDTTREDAFDFCRRMQETGVTTLICTDISRDGAMKGTNLELYRRLSEAFSMRITASGGVSAMEDVVALRNMNLYGAIIGKAYYTGAVSLREAIEVAR
ncbi:MAG: 1-(5-phosphoribosyl)-5-[Clostridia bacterium]|nr:1-(5-phosphoribosyl)-5-[(5-phosphoribosylamino)methylideneamino]imidazole-4-carboxamide isomerase [Clostridia bacterium]